MSLIKLDRDNEITSFIVIFGDLILTGKFYCLNFLKKMVLIEISTSTILSF